MPCINQAVARWQAPGGLRRLRAFVLPMCRRYKLATPKFVEKNTLCEAVALHPERVQAWVDGAISLAASISGRSFGSTRGGDGGANSSGKRGIQAAAAAAGTDAGINPSTVFSHFKWKDPCTGSTYLTPIEPLVGHMRWVPLGRPPASGLMTACSPGAVAGCPAKQLPAAHTPCRHPLAPHCIPNSTVDIESKDYLLFSGLTPEQFQKTYPGEEALAWLPTMVALAALDGTACLLMLSLGRHAVGMLAPLAVQMDALTQYPPAAGRKLLMDFGAGQGYEGQELRSSLSYLLPHYEQMGVHFDEVWAWEPRPVNQSTYWQGVPPDVKFRLHVSARHTRQGRTWSALAGSVVVAAGG